MRIYSTENVEEPFGGPQVKSLLLATGPAMFLPDNDGALSAVGDGSGRRGGALR
jgi:hypothetical protein